MGIKPSRRLFGAVTLTVLLAACAGPVPKINASAEKLAAIKTIAVIRAPEPQTYPVMNLGHPGVAFGLIGGLLAVGDQIAKEDRLSTAFKSQGVAFTEHLADQLAARLAASGYETRIEDGPWEEAGGRYKIAFEKIDSSADAVLVVSPTLIGFVATSFADDYLPTVSTVATLLTKDRKEELYRGFHASGWAPKTDGWTISVPKMTFSDFNELMSDTKAAAAALNDAGSIVAEMVNSDLHK